VKGGGGSTAAKNRRSRGRRPACRKNGKSNAKAKEHFQRFFDFWKSGDLDRDPLLEAKRALAQ
jgi:hypothetical protein